MVYDALTRGLARTNIRVATGAKPQMGILNLLMPEGTGTPDDVVRYSYEDNGVYLPEQAVRGDDPTRVNYGTPFNENYIKGAYFFPEQPLALASAQNRLFEEPLESPWSVEQREIFLAAKIRDKMHYGFEFQRLSLAKDAIFTGSFTTKDGGKQTFPVVASNLTLAGATLSTKPMEVLSKAAAPLIKKGHRVSRLIMNPVTAATVMQGTGWTDILKAYHINTTLDPAQVDDGGLSYVGTIPFAGGLISLYVCWATVDGSSYFIDDSKAIICGDAIGRMDHCGVLQANGAVQAQVAAKELFTVYGEERGALVTTKLQGQTAPCPIITNIDGYGVLTSIS